jgi:hypothetical protein
MDFVSHSTKEFQRDSSLSVQFDTAVFLTLLPVLEYKKTAKRVGERKRNSYWTLVVTHEGKAL